jgi:hypothetical protein
MARGSGISGSKIPFYRQTPERNPRKRQRDCCGFYHQQSRVMARFEVGVASIPTGQPSSSRASNREARWLKAPGQS